MSDEVQSTEVKAEESSYQAPSLNQVLDKVRGKTPEPTPEPEVTETPVAIEAPVVESPQVETLVVEDAIETEAEIEPDPGVGKPQKGFVPVAVARSERQKRQQIEAQAQTLQILNQQLQAQILQGQQTTPQYETPLTPQEIDPTIVRNQVATMSEHLAKQAHPDYDEKYSAFAEAYRTSPQKYQALYEQIMGSEHPGEAAYRAGEQILFAKKYGPDVIANPGKFADVIRKEHEADLRKKIESEVHAKIQGKLTERSKTPTDISQARSAGGTSEAEYRTPTLDETFAKIRKKRR